jgi:hypothetical protein
LRAAVRVSKRFRMSVTVANSFVSASTLFM